MDNKKQIRRRILIFTVSVLFLFSLFAVDLFRIQIVNAADYSTQRVALSETKSTIAASRGEILDCNGTPLVTNEQINSVVLNASYFPSTKEQDKRNEIILSLINLLESEGAAWNDNLPLVLNSDGSVSFKENADKDITYLKSKDVLYLNSYATAQNCFDELVGGRRTQNRVRLLFFKENFVFGGKSVHGGRLRFTDARRQNQREQQLLQGC